SDNVKYLNSRIGRSEIRDSKDSAPTKAGTADKTAAEQPTLKKSGFKEKFMKNERLPNYESLLMKQENITTYVGKPGTVNPASDISQESEKQAFVPPNTEAPKGNNSWTEDPDEIPYKYNSLMKKIGEFFK
ncbi:MAG TPA: hypothetical protein PLG67_05375, partial [Bacillota bacterium]|nr:hypothetical protein [Bacillota bacterium]